MSLRGRQLFVGNLPFSVGWQDLKDLFRQAGSVQHANVMLARDGRPRGHGIVLFATLEDAKKAQEMFNGHEWHGRVIEVREDRSIADVPRKPEPSKNEDLNDLADSLEQKLSVKTDAGRKNETTTGQEQTTNGTWEETKDESKEEGKPNQTSTVHVGNIPFRMKWQDLKDLFRKAGRVVRADIALGADNRSKGFGTVIFSTEEEAKSAIVMFDQYQWQDRIIHVRQDRSGMENNRHQDRPPVLGPGPDHNGPFFGAHPSMNPNFAGRQVFVGNLSFQCQWQDLKDLFRKAGTVVRADVVLGYDGRSRGFGSVQFATPEDANNAINMFDNFNYKGRLLRVHHDRMTPSGHGPPMHGGMGPMMHPHPHPHHHPHAHHHHPHHQPPHHPHRLHAMHPQHGHGFPPTFHQPPPPMMPLRGPPIHHGGAVPPPPPPGQFNMGPMPFGVRNYSPSLLGPGSTHAQEFSPSDGSVRTSASPLPSDLPGPIGTSDRVTSPHHFDSTAPSSIGMSSPAPTAPSASMSGVGTGIGAGTLPGSGVGAFSAVTGSQHAPIPGSPSHHYSPFLTPLGPLGPIGKGYLTHNMMEHPVPGFLSTTTVSNPISGIMTSGEDDFMSRTFGYPPLYPSGGTDTSNDGHIDMSMKREIGKDSGLGHGDYGNTGFSPGFYMFQGHQIQQPQLRDLQDQSGYLQQLQQQEQQQQQQQTHQPYQSQQPPLGYPVYMPEPTHLVHSRNGTIGSGGLEHGYPNQHEWGHPNSFMMGPPPILYGLQPFGPYGHHQRDLDEEEGGVGRDVGNNEGVAAGRE